MPPKAKKLAIPIKLIPAHSAAELEPQTPIKRRIKASTMGRWRALALLLVHVLIGLHIAHWLTAGETMTPVEPSEAMAFSRDSIVNAGLIFFAAMILLTAVFGRFFCGWACHVLALQDFCRYLMLKVGITPKPLRSYTLAWVPALAFAYMFIWPLVYRVWIGDSLAVRGVELTTEHFWATFPGLVVGFLTLFISGFLCVYFLGAKGFCTYACPYGAIFAAVDRVAPLRIRVTDACSQCGHCTAVCSSNVRVHEEVRDWGMVVSPGCMKCQDCVSVCPKGALYYGSGPIPLFAKPRRELPPKAKILWRDELVLALVFALTFVTVRGLYGLVPFLMALGVAAVTAFLVLTALRMLSDGTVARPGLRLKRAGLWLPGGKVFFTVVLCLLVGLVHSGIVRVHEHLGSEALSKLDAPRLALLAQPGHPAPLSVPEQRAVAQGIAALHTVEQWGLIPSLGNSARLAWLFALQNNTEQALEYAQQGLGRNEWPGEMQQLIAHAKVAQGRTPEAIEHWEAAIQSSPERPEAYLALGLAKAAANDLLAAQEVFDRGLAAVPGSPALSYNAALARALSGQTPASIPLFEQALKLNPDYRAARENLAGVYASLGQFDASIRHYRFALAQAPDDAQTRVLLARALLGAGESTAAKSELERVLAADPTNAEAKSIISAL